MILIDTIKQIYKEHKEYRKQILPLAKNDIAKTYRGAALGWSWALVRPAMMIFVFWFAIELGLKGGGNFSDFPFFYWLIAGLIPWFYMRDALTEGVNAMRRYKHLITKMKFPISIIPTFVNLGYLGVNLVFTAIMLIIFWFSGYKPDIYEVQIIFYLVLMFAFFTAWTLFGSLLAALSKDFLNLIKSLVQAVFWLSGIIYSVPHTGFPFLEKVMMWNPVYFFASGIRDAMIYKVWFWERPGTMLCFVIMFIVMVLLAIWAYYRLPKEVADVL